MKALLLISLTSLGFSSMAMDLKVYEGQAKWKADWASADGYADAIEVKDTGRGIRLEHAAGFRSPAIVRIPKRIVKMVDSSHAMQICANVSKIQASDRLQLQMKAYPLARQTPLYLESAQKTLKAGELLNAPIINGFSVQFIRRGYMPLSFDPDLNRALRQNGNVDLFLKNLEHHLSEQVRAQAEVVKETGELILDLSGYPTVACDIALHYLGLKVSAEISFQRGSLETFEYLQIGDLVKTYEFLSSKKINGQGLPSLIYAGVHLGQALEKAQVSLASLNMQRLWNIFQALFDWSLARPQLKVKSLDLEALKVVKNELAEVIKPETDIVDSRVTTVAIDIKVEGLN